MHDSTQNSGSSQENSDRAKVLRKLMAKWFTTKETRRKADLLLEKHPHIKVSGLSRRRGGH